MLDAISEFDKALTVAKLRGARERTRRDTGKCEGRKSHAERNPEVAGTRPGRGERRLLDGETDMTKAFIGFIVAIAVLWTSNAIAQTAEPQPKLVVDAPLPEPLSRGVALIRYRTENLQILPVFGPQALEVSPRIGHLHVAVDGASWVWAETSGGPIIVAGLPEGPHKVEITPVNANHQPLDRSVVVEFMIPGRKGTK